MELTRKLSTVLAPTAYLAKWKSKALVSVAVDPLASDEAERGLKFGDCISLFSAEHNGYMSTDGFSDEICHLKKVPQGQGAQSPLHFENCVFEVVPRFKYDMQVNLNDILSTYGRERESIGVYEDGDVLVENQLKALVKQEELENEENLAEYHRTAGKEVAYGQIVQLRHVKSQCFISLTVKEAAELEKDSLRLVLEKEGSEGSWFIIAPCLKMRSEGESVNLGDQVAFVSKKYNIFLHCAMKNSRSEISGSPTFSPWRVIPFAPYVPSGSIRNLRAGEVVRIFHKEIEAFLTEEFQMNDNHLSGLDELKSGTETTSAIHLFFESYSMSKPNQTGQTAAASVFTAQSSYSASNSNSLWLIERENTMRGGIITFEDSIRFKHISSGKYLASELLLDDIDSDSVQAPLAGANATFGSAQASSSTPTPISDPFHSPGPSGPLGSSKSNASSTANTLNRAHRSKQLGRPTPTTSRQGLANLSVSSSSSTLARKPLKLRFFMIDDPNSTNALFTLHSANNPTQSEGPIEMDSFLRIRHRDTKCWLHAATGDQEVAEKPAPKRLAPRHAKSASPAPFSSLPSSPAPVYPLGQSQKRDEPVVERTITEVEARSAFFDSDVYVLAPVPAADVRTLYQVLSEIHYLKSYLGTLTRAAAHSFYQNDRRMSKWLSNDTRRLGRVLQALIEGCKSYSGSRMTQSAISSHQSPEYKKSSTNSFIADIGSSGEDSAQGSGWKGGSLNPVASVGSSNIVPNLAMQNLLREQNIADVLVAILARIFKNFKTEEEIDSFKAQSENFGFLNVCKLSYGLLRHLAIENSSNRAYLSKYVPFMFSQVGLSIKAAATLMELFKDNFDLATNITEATMTRCFIDRLAERPVLRYIQFLGVLCECQGAPLSKNQDFIARSLISDRPDMFLPLKASKLPDGSSYIEVRVPTKNHFRWLGLTELIDTFSPQSKVMTYLVESVELLSQLCLGGNPITCSLIAAQITPSMINACLQHDALAPALRASFCRLLLNMILADKDISKSVSFLNYTRLWSDIHKEYLKHLASEGSSSKAPSLTPTRSSSSISTSTGGVPSIRKGARISSRKVAFAFPASELQTIKSFILSHLKKVAENSQGPGSDVNRLTAAVTELTRHLFSFGCFSQEDILVLVPLLLQVSRSHSFGPTYLYFEPEEKVHLNISPFEKSPLTRHIMDFKLSIGQILDMACDYRTNSRLTQSLVLYKRTLEQPSKKSPSATSSPRGDTHSSSNESFGIGGVFDQIGSALRNMIAQESIPDTLESILDLMAMDTETYVPILSDFILHDQPNLATLGSRLLVRHYSQKQELLDALYNVQILVDPELVGTYQLVSKSISALKGLISSNLAPETVDLNRQQESAIMVLDSLIALIKRPEPANIASSNSKDALLRIHEHQRLMLNLHADETVLELMQFDVAKLSFFLMTKCYDFLQNICRGPFSDGQASLHRHLDFFLEHLDDEELSLHAASTIQAIFEGNRAISSQVTDVQVRKILQQVARQKLPIYLDILYTLAMIDGKPYRRNQNLVAKMLMEKQLDVVVLYNDTASLKRRNEMIKHLQFLEPTSELVYHLKLLDLFVLSCKGKVYEAEMKCQTLFSLDDILFQITDRANWPRIKAAFIALLEEAYLVTERSLKNIVQAPQIWELMEVFIRDFGAHLNHELTSRSHPKDHSFPDSRITSSKSTPVAVVDSQPPISGTETVLARPASPKATTRRGLLQVKPSLLQQVQHSSETPSDRGSISSDPPVSQPVTGAPRLLRREIKQSDVVPLEATGRTRTLSKGSSSPALPIQPLLDSPSTEPLSHGSYAPPSQDSTAPISASNRMSSTQTARVALIRRGGALRGLAVSNDALAKHGTSVESPIAAHNNRSPATQSLGIETIPANEEPTSTAIGSSYGGPETVDTRIQLRQIQSHQPTSLCKKSVSWRGASTTHSDLLDENTAHVNQGNIEESPLVADSNPGDKEEKLPSTGLEAPDDLLVLQSSLSSSSSISESSESSSSSSESSSDSEDEEREERRAAERLAAARARDAALVAEAEMEASVEAVKAEEAKASDDRDAAIKRKHFFNDERHFIFYSVLPFLSKFSTVYWVSKKFDSAQTDKLNELIDAAFELTSITDLTTQELSSLVHCFESMKTRGLIGAENPAAVEKFVAHFRGSSSAHPHNHPNGATEKSSETHAQYHDTAKKRALSMAPAPLLSSFSNLPNLSGDGSLPPLISSGTLQRIRRRTTSYKDISTTMTSSDDVTHGLRVFHADCRSVLKSDHELAGLASFFKKDMANEDAAALSLTSKLMRQLGDPAYSLYHASDPIVILHILRALRLIMVGPRIDAAKAKEDSSEDLLSEIERSFPHAQTIYEAMEAQVSAGKIDENETSDEKLSCNRSVSTSVVLPSWLSSSLGSIGQAFSRSAEGELAESDDYEAELTAIQNRIDSLGAIPVAISLIASQTEYVAQEAILFAISLLWGGNKAVQEHILNVFQTTFHGELFFHEVRARLRRGLVEVEERRELTRKQHMEQVGDQLEETFADSESSSVVSSAKSTPRGQIATGSESDSNLNHEDHKRPKDVDSSSMEDDHTHISVIKTISVASQMTKSAKDMKAMEELLRMLQLLCEGHNHLLQDHIRQQRHSLQSYDLVSETAVYLEALERNIDAGSVSTAIQVFNSLTEYCQGPCLDNQMALTKTKLCDSVNYLFHDSNIRCNRIDGLELQIAMVTTLLSLLEGAGTNPSIPRHLLATLDLSSIERNIKAIVKDVTAVLSKLGKSAPKSSNRWTGQHFKSIFDSSDLPEDIQAQIECGYLYFFLLRTLNDYDSNGKIGRILATFPPDNFFASAVGSLEIVRDGQMERLYFRIPAVCSQLTANSKEDLIRNVKRTNQQEKLEDMFERSEHLLSEMEHRELLSNSPNFSWMASNEEGFKNLSFVFSLLINALIIGFYTSGDEVSSSTSINEAQADLTASDSVGGNFSASSRSFSISPWIVLMMFLLALAQLAFSGLTLFIYIVSYLPLRLRKRWDSASPSFASFRHGSALTLAYIAFSDTYFVYYLLYMVFALLGIINMPNAPYFFAFHLLDIVVRSELLKYVIKSVTANGKAIMLTACLALVVVYIYSIFGFLFFRSKFGAEAGCDSMLMCLVTSINMGLRSGGGIGDIMEPPTWTDADTHWRILYDSTFFFLVIVIMLNIIFGIIIDTFGELRAQNNEIEEDIRNKCFVCGIDRETFDRNADGFDHHIQSDHHVFHYIYFFMYLRRKERTEYTGPEQYVADLLKARSWTFMPALRAMALGGDHQGEAEKSEEILDGVQRLSKLTSTHLEQLKRGLSKKQAEIDEKLSSDSQRTENLNTQILETFDSYDTRLLQLEDKLDRILRLLDAQNHAQTQTNLQMSKLVTSTTNLSLSQSNTTKRPSDTSNARPEPDLPPLRSSGPSQTNASSSIPLDPHMPLMGQESSTPVEIQGSLSSSGASRPLRMASRTLRTSASPSPSTSPSLGPHE
jgi:hypothetical protein